MNLFTINCFVQIFVGNENGQLKEIWSQLEGSSNHWAGYHNINRGDMEAIQNAIYHISYLAKTRGKGYRPTQTKDYGWARNICAAVSTETTPRKSK